MSRVAGTAQIALAAAGIYLTDHALTAFFNDADKLVADRSIEARVATRDLQICVANTSQNNADECIIGPIRFLYIFY